MPQRDDSPVHFIILATLTTAFFVAGIQWNGWMAIGNALHALVN